MASGHHHHAPGREAGAQRRTLTNPPTPTDIHRGVVRGPSPSPGGDKREGGIRSPSPCPRKGGRDTETNSHEPTHTHPIPLWIVVMVWVGWVGGAVDCMDAFLQEASKA